MDLLGIFNKFIMHILYGFENDAYFIWISKYIKVSFLKVLSGTY